MLATSTSVNSCGDEIVKLTDNTSDQKTGLTLSSRDAAGVQTSYLHDELGRIQAVKPTGIASTTYNYEVPTPGWFPHRRAGYSLGDQLVEGLELMFWGSHLKIYAFGGPADMRKGRSD